MRGPWAGRRRLLAGHALLGGLQRGYQPVRGHAQLVGDRGERRAGGVDAVPAQPDELVERTLGRAVAYAELGGECAHKRLLVGLARLLATLFARLPAGFGSEHG